MTAPAWREVLARELGGIVDFDLPLAPRVAFRIGGPADAFVRPESPAQLATLLRIARELEVPVTVLGTGSNVLVSDRGIRGITVRLAGELADVHAAPAPSGDSVELDAGAGALNAPLVSLAMSLGAVGLEFLATIPGTFGGALIMNAGAHGGEIESFVESVSLVRADLELEVRPRAACGFVYRGSGFASGELLTGARLRVPRGAVESARAHLVELRRKRRASQPNDHPNAGSIFKNPAGDHAGRLIEAAGLKGRRAGGALISPVHANFIVNAGGATARDVLDLAELARRAVLDRFSINLEWEVRRIGDW